MQLAIGTDFVKIERLRSWQSRDEQQLQKIFTQQELRDCRARDGLYDCASLAARFAAKEAFYKALSSYLVQAQRQLPSVAFIRIARLVQVAKDPHWQVPQLVVDWSYLEQAFDYPLQGLYASVSLAHDGEYAQAFVIVSTAR